MAQGKEAEDLGIGVYVSKHTAGSVKLSQGLLSFRSRKLLRGSLLKRSDTTNVDKRAAAIPTNEVSNLERRKAISNEAHGEPTTACRMLWDPRKVESDAVKSSTGLSTRQSKKTEPMKVKKVNDGSVQRDPVVETSRTQQLSPKLKLLETFYEGVEAACSLLRIRKQMCTFRAVCKIVESMSKRRFLLKHLAQMKHIFAEGLELEYVRCQDPDSWGERLDLRITFRPLPSDCPHTCSPLKGSAGQTAQTVRRRKEFHARLRSFARSHPENEDIPMEPLPRRSFGGDALQPTAAQQAASPPNKEISGSQASAQVGNSETSTQPLDAEAPTQVGTEELQFSTVKPYRDSNIIPLGGTPHFLASFRPFFSTFQTTERVVEPPVTLPHESHFPDSFRPSFSGATSDAPNDLPLKLPKAVLSVRSLPGSLDEENDENLVVKSRSGSRDELSTSVSDNSASRSDNGFRLSPSSPLPSSRKEQSCLIPPTTPVPSVKSEELPIRSTESSFQFLPSTPAPSANSTELIPSSTDKGCPLSQHRRSLFPVSPYPINTPPFLSPMNRIFSSTHDSSSETSCKTPSADSLTDRLHGTVRSLRFVSPVRGPPQAQIEYSDNYRRTDSLNSTINSSPSNASCVKVAHTSVSTPGTPAPETPGLQTPVRTTQPKEALYSPPKRMKLRASLFNNDRDNKEETHISGWSISCARESGPEAVAEDFYNSSQRGSSKASSPHPTAKDNKIITESDLDVLRCLPHDLVQSVLEKERMMKETHSMELVKQRRRQQMMSGVPKLFNQLRLIYQSLNRSVLSEHELIRTILTSHPEVTDKEEVEERLKLITELAPEYIHTRPSHSGELLYRVDKKANFVQIMRRLAHSHEEKPLI